MTVQKLDRVIAISCGGIDSHFLIGFGFDI